MASVIIPQPIYNMQEVRRDFYSVFPGRDFASLRVLSKYGIILVPSFVLVLIKRKGGEFLLDIFVNLIVSVLANVIGGCISKWIDRHTGRR